MTLGKLLHVFESQFIICIVVKTVFPSLRMCNHVVWLIVDNQSMDSFFFDCWPRKLELYLISYQAFKGTVEKVHYLV